MRGKAGQLAVIFLGAEKGIGFEDFCLQKKDNFFLDLAIPKK
jgi:hypothetical protein